MKDQSQSAGDNSTNVAAGRDVHLHGADREQMRDIAKAVFLDNFITLKDHAAAVARSRADEITDELLNRLFAGGRQPGGFSDPDLLNTWFQAQKGYALSGDVDLKRVLLDLVEARSDDPRDLERLVLNEAVATAPKLTESQRRAIALVFALRHVRPIDIFEIDLELFLRHHLLRCLSSLIDAVAIRAVDCWHIEYVGAGKLNPLSGGWDEILQLQVPQLASGRLHAKMLQSVPAGLRSELLVEDSRDWFRLRLEREDALRLVSDSAEPEAATAAVSHAYDRALREVDDARVKSARLVPELSSLIEGWDSNPISGLTLSSVGMAIGHAYWSNVTEQGTPFRDWLTA